MVDRASPLSSAASVEDQVCKVMEDSYERHKFEPGVYDSTAEVYDEVFLKRNVNRSKSWTAPEPSAETTASKTRGLRNGLSARNASFTIQSCRFSSRQGDIVQALKARELNRSFGRVGDMSKALEAREKNRVSLQRGQHVEDSRKLEAVASVVGEPAANYCSSEGEPKDHGNVSLHQKASVGGAVQSPVPQQERQTLTVPTLTSSYGTTSGVLGQRKSNLKSSSAKTTTPSDKEKKASTAPRGRVLILTSAEPLVETEVPTPRGLHPASGPLRTSLAQMPAPPESPNVNVSISSPGHVGERLTGLDDLSLVNIGSVEGEGGQSQLDQGDGFVAAVASLHERGAGSHSEIKEIEEPSRVRADEATGSAEIASEFPGREGMASSGVEHLSIEVSATTHTQDREDMSAMDSATVDANLEARLRRLKTNNVWPLSPTDGGTPTVVMSLSDQVKALRFASTRLLVSHLISSASAPVISTRDLSMSPSRLTSRLPASQVQGNAPTSSPTGLSPCENPVLAPESASDASSSSCSSCFRTCVKRRRHRKLNGTAGLPSFSHSFPPPGSQKMQTPVPRSQSLRPKDETSPVEEDGQAYLDSMMDELQLEQQEAVRKTDAEVMKENLYGAKVLQSFSLKDINEELSRVSEEADCLALEAEGLVQLATDASQMGKEEWAGESELDSSNGVTNARKGRRSYQTLSKPPAGGFDDGGGGGDSSAVDELQLVMDSNKKKRDGRRRYST